VVGRVEDDACKSMIAIGSLELLPVDSDQSLQDAYRRRIQWSYWLNKISQKPSPEARSEELLASFDAFFEPEVVSTLPVDLLALLVGVLPRTMAAVRRSHYRSLDGRNLDGRGLDGRSLDGIAEGAGLEGWVDRMDHADRWGVRSARSWRPIEPKEFQLSTLVPKPVEAVADQMADQMADRTALIAV
jgi:hypothetical protein